MQYTSLTPDIILNSLMYRTLFCVNIYGSYKLLKTVRFFLAHPVQWHCVMQSSNGKNQTEFDIELNHFLLGESRIVTTDSFIDR